jgi:aspartyl-tRNA(Asn)/glutamyl-tRNA(Gln) amidotransferase subunit A
VAASDELRRLDASEIARLVGTGSLGPVELAEAHLAALEVEAALNAVITATPERALERARAGVSGRLAGVPVLVKDLFDTKGVRTTYGSAIFRDHVPDADAAAVRLLEAEGALVIGKANLDEFAWGTTSQNPHFGWVRNPRFPGRTPGGSSGGNAAALAAGVSALGVGTDTGGSLRMPAACCDVVGYKPAWGKVPIEGCFPLGPTFDHAGPIARSVRDCALAYSVLSGEPVPEPRIDGLVVGVLAHGSRASAHEIGDDARVDPAQVEQTAAALEALGARVVAAELPEPDADVVPLFLHEFAATHARLGLYPERREEYGETARLKWDAAAQVPAEAVEAARVALARWRERARREPAVDLLLCPTLGIRIPEEDVYEPDFRVLMSTYTRPFNFLGWPALAVGGFQLAGREDATVLAAGLAWEEAHGQDRARAAS